MKLPWHKLPKSGAPKPGRDWRDWEKGTQNKSFKIDSLRGNLVAPALNFSSLRLLLFVQLRKDFTHTDTPPLKRNGPEEAPPYLATAPGEEISAAGEGAT